MVFYVTWDDSGLGFCMMGYNPCWPCPYMTEHMYPPSLRLENDPDSDMVVVIKEPGPGPIQCCLLTITPGILFLPSFIYQARAIYLEFRKDKFDRVHVTYRCKNLCWENTLKMYEIRQVWINTEDVTEHGKKRNLYTMKFTHRDGEFSWDDMALTNARWKEQLEKIVDSANRLINSAPF